MKSFEIGAGERRRILHLVSDSVPQQVRFRAEPMNGAGAVDGQVEVQGSRWLFRKPPVALRLKPENVVNKGMWDSLFSVSVIPDQDVRIILETRHFTSRILLLVLVAVLVVGVAAALTSRFMG